MPSSSRKPTIRYRCTGMRGCHRLPVGADIIRPQAAIRYRRNPARKCSPITVGEGLAPPARGNRRFSSAPGRMREPTQYRRAGQAPPLRWGQGFYRYRCVAKGRGSDLWPPCLKGAGTADLPRGRDWGIRSSAPARGEPYPPVSSQARCHPAALSKCAGGTFVA